jgi:minor extracellular serine protease Vpr
MKKLVSQIVLLSVFNLAAFNLAAAAAPAITKKPYHRQRSAAARPRAAGDTVVVNAASFEPGISPGGLATIFGADLTSVSGVVIASGFPLPLELAGVSVLVDGISAPIYSIAFNNGEDQISFQVPYATRTGPGAVQVEVLDRGEETANIVTDSFTEDPGIFAYNGNYALAVHPSDGALVGPSDPAFPGEVLVLYVTALGPLSLDLDDGYPAPSDPLAQTTEPFDVLLDGELSQVLFSGLAPGFVGLYQINFRVPGDAASGNLDLQIRSPFASSRVAVLPVR